MIWRALSTFARTNVGVWGHAVGQPDVWCRGWETCSGTTWCLMEAMTEWRFIVRVNSQTFSSTSSCLNDSNVRFVHTSLLLHYHHDFQCFFFILLHHDCTNEDLFEAWHSGITSRKRPFSAISLHLTCLLSSWYSTSNKGAVVFQRLESRVTQCIRVWWRQASLKRQSVAVAGAASAAVFSPAWKQWKTAWRSGDLS